MTTGTDPSWGLETRPPAAVLWPAALQHVGIGSVTLVFPLLVAEAAGADARTVTHYIALSMVALGIATLLQASGRRGIGSGFLLPAVFTAVYFPPSVLAAQSGGLGAVAGLTIAAGVTQILLSFAVRRMRPYLPTELAGLIVLMIGLVLGLLGLRLMLGYAPGRDAAAGEVPDALVALAAIVVIAIWGPRRWRPVAVLAGIGIGIALHLVRRLAEGAWPAAAALPIDLVAWPLAVPSLPWTLLPGVLLGALACLVRASGDIVACQRANDPQWKRPDFGSIRAGVLADGMGALAAGAIGVPGTNTYTGSVGLSIATGVTARRVALAVGVLWIVLGLVPGAPALLLAVPRGVLGAALFFTAAFIVVTGMGIVVQRMLDARRVVAVGMALLVGVSYDAAPQIFAHLPPAMRLLLTSSLVLGLLVGLVLTAAFRAGTTQQRRLSWHPSEGHQALEAFATECGGIWGARAEVIARLRSALEEAAALLPRVMAPRATLEITARFDEYNIDVALAWVGDPLPAAISPAPSLEEPDERDLGERLAALMLRRAADRVAEVALPGGRRELRLHYDH